MGTQKTIGDLIEHEVRKQQIPITEFAQMINCKRNNVYDIFKRNNIDIKQLVDISKVLNHDFLDEVRKDNSLVDVPHEENEKDEYNRKAVNQFMEVVPRILKELGKETTIAFGGQDEDEILPDFSLPLYCITFTIGSTWVEKSKTLSGSVFEIEQISDGDKISFYSVINKPYGSQIVDIKLDYKSETEWRKILEFVFKTFPNLNFYKSCKRFYHSY